MGYFNQSRCVNVVHSFDLINLFDLIFGLVFAVTELYYTFVICTQCKQTIL